MFPTEMYVRVVGPERAFVDGFGKSFNSQVYWNHLRAGVAKLTAPEPPVPGVEPVWKDCPAGFRRCPVIFEDHEQGKGHYA